MSEATDPSGEGTIDGFDSAMIYLRDRTDLERSIRRAADARIAFNLDRMSALVAALGHPQHALLTVHVAGSKGKGSVCEMLAAALKGCGCTVGLYTSPHLTDLRERIRVGGRMISRAHLAAALAAVQAAERTLPEPLRPVTYFEAMTAAAFVHFRENAVDIAVIETGLGGLHDATNVLRPDVCVITAIQPEHTDVLGPTLADIARHKAGIIKPHVPALTIPQVQAVERIIRQKAESVGAPLAVVGEDIPVSFQHPPDDPARTLVTIRTGRGDLGPVPAPFPGEHQAMNCALVLAVLDRVQDLGIKTPLKKIAAGLAATPSHGRLELISTSPRVIVDGAHTPESVRAAVATLGKVHPHDSLIVIFGCAADKDARAMLADLSRAADKLILTASAGPRAAPPATLLTQVPPDARASAHAVPTVRAAIQAATRAAGGADLILVIGSFALAGEAKQTTRE